MLAWFSSRQTYPGSSKFQQKALCQSSHVLMNISSEIRWSRVLSKLAGPRSQLRFDLAWSPCSLFSQICRRHACHYSQTTPRAVSSVVEHLVYTERVGGSKPSPPSLI